ncbi:hypothetical protein BLNAU_18111 [Blattamonas nauphoetae]|uniref:Uncharacterized protein n=1 Tax=Blattamonas nauphoetae TaxID=2049346 RepID=A0ABQ9X5T8_9EUKA|nr:hypothetical protein BLNAU_18111 [Blattamonas nauphoetae]
MTALHDKFHHFLLGCLDYCSFKADGLLPTQLEHVVTLSEQFIFPHFGRQLNTTSEQCERWTNDLIKILQPVKSDTCSANLDKIKPYRSVTTNRTGGIEYRLVD